MTPFQLENMLRNHDWFYEFSDDHVKWLRGIGQRDEILQTSKQLSLDDIRPLLYKYCPKDQLSEWTDSILGVRK